MTHTIHADLGPIEKILKEPIKRIDEVNTVAAPLASMRASLSSVVDAPIKMLSADAKGSNISALEKFPKFETNRFVAVPASGLASDVRTMVDRRVIKA